MAGQPELRKALVAGKWVWCSKDNENGVILTFHPDGTAGHVGMRGNWRVTGPNEVTIDTTDGDGQYILRFNSALQTFEGNRGGVHGSAVGTDSNDPMVGQPELRKALVAGKWVWCSKDNENGVILTFHPDGTAGHVGMRGNWRVTGPNEVTINTTDGDGQYVLRFNSALQAFEGDRGGVHGSAVNREDPDKILDPSAVAANLPPSQQILPLLEPSLNAILAPLETDPQMPRVRVETLRASLGGGLVKAKTPSQKQIYQCAIAACEALTKGMDERTEARAAAVASGLLPSVSNGGSIVKTSPLRGRDAGGNAEAIRKKQQDERSYADEQAKNLSKFMESSAYKAWITKATSLRENVMSLYGKLVQLEAAESPTEAAR